MNGVTLQSVSLGPVSIYYGVLDGQLVLTDSQTAIGELQSKSNRLADDDTFKAAKKASGLPDSSPAWLYVDLQDTIPAVESLATLAGQAGPADGRPESAAAEEPGRLRLDGQRHDDRRASSCRPSSVLRLHSERVG